MLCEFAARSQRLAGCEENHCLGLLDFFFLQGMEHSPIICEGGNGIGRALVRVPQMNLELNKIKNVQCVEKGISAYRHEACTDMCLSWTRLAVNVVAVLPL